MATYHEFDEKAVATAIQTASDFYAEKGMMKAGAKAELADDGHMNIAAQCISVTVDNGKICLNLPLGIGKVCLPIPSIFPNGTAAEACLSICTTWHIPTGVKVTVSIAGNTVITKSFGKC